MTTLAPHTTEAIPTGRRPDEEVGELFAGVDLARRFRSRTGASRFPTRSERRNDPTLLCAVVNAYHPTNADSDPGEEGWHSRQGFLTRWSGYMDEYDDQTGKIWVLPRLETTSSQPLAVDLRIVDWGMTLSHSTPLTPTVADTTAIPWYATAPDPARPDPLPNSRAFRAFTELRTWLHLSVDEAADLVGVGRTTPNAWERDGREPQPRTARRLFQLHALIGAVVRRLNQEGADAWLMAGTPTPMELARRPDLSGLADAVEGLVMSGPQAPMPGSEIAEPEAVVSSPVSGRRRRLGTRRRPSPS